jgi:predicted CXXCH cytochrome family protein
MLVVAAIGFAGWGLVPHPVLAQSTTDDDGPHEALRLEMGWFQTRGEDGWADITNITTYCLECHGDGEAVRPDRSDASAPEASHELGGLGRSHPVDVEYPSGGSGYRPIDRLDEKITLVDGRVICLTCHAASADRSLVLPTKGGKLCIACHEM